MAMETDPTRTVELVLSRHEDQPANKRPTWLFRVLTRRDSKRLVPILKTLHDLKTNAGEDAAEQLFDDIEAFLKDQLTGWRNAGVPFKTADDLDTLIGEADMIELVMRLRAEGMLGSADRKKSASRSRSQTKHRANTARRRSA